jgi:hypothetical protein
MSSLSDTVLADFVMEVIQNNPGATAPVHSLITLIAAMSERLNEEQRVLVAFLLRDVADQLDEPRWN